MSISDCLVDLFYTQALQALRTSADKDYPDHRLSVRVRFILNGFATKTEIPDVDKVISVIYSREIYVSIILSGVRGDQGVSPGRPIGLLDMLIAGHARAEKLTQATLWNLMFRA